MAEIGATLALFLLTRLWPLAVVTLIISPLTCATLLHFADTSMLVLFGRANLHG